MICLQSKLGSAKQPKGSVRFCYGVHLACFLNVCVWKAWSPGDEVKALGRGPGTVKLGDWEADLREDG